MFVDDLMTGGVIAVGASTSAWDAISKMRDAAIHELPVLEGGRLVGIVTERDLYRYLGSRLSNPPAEHMIDAKARAPVSACMTTPAFSVKKSATVAEACTMLMELRVGALPVVDESQRVVGMLSVTDVLRVAAAAL